MAQETLVLDGDKVVGVKPAADDELSASEALGVELLQNLLKKVEKFDDLEERVSFLERELSDAQRDLDEVRGQVEEYDVDEISDDLESVKTDLEDLKDVLRNV